MESVKAAYLAQARQALRFSPMLVSEAAVQEWLERIDILDRTTRFSEADELRDWMNVAFGRDAADDLRPLDLRIHRRLGELYAKAGDPSRAAGEFELARQLAPRDIYVLRRLGKAYLDAADICEAGRVVDTIEELDPLAFVRNVENAALKARWHRASSDTASERDVLRAAFKAHPKSYYVGDLLGQAELTLGDRDAAIATYRRVIRVIDGLHESNVWSLATGLTAALVAGDAVRQENYVSRLCEQRVTPEEARSVLNGLTRVADSIDAAGPIGETLAGAFGVSSLQHDGSGSAGAGR